MFPNAVVEKSWCLKGSLGLFIFDCQTREQLRVSSMGVEGAWHPGHTRPGCCRYTCSNGSCRPNCLHKMELKMVNICFEM